MPRLKSDLQVKAAIALCQSWGAYAAVVHKGFADAGALLVKINRLDGRVSVLLQTRDGEGKLQWTSGLDPEVGDEARADDYIARQLKYDDDLWVIEVEDKAGRNPFDP